MIALSRQIGILYERIAPMGALMMSEDSRVAAGMQGAAPAAVQPRLPPLLLPLLPPPPLCYICKYIGTYLVLPMMPNL